MNKFILLFFIIIGGGTLFYSCSEETPDTEIPDGSGNQDSDGKDESGSNEDGNQGGDGEEEGNDNDNENVEPYIPSVLMTEYQYFRSMGSEPYVSRMTYDNNNHITGIYVYRPNENEPGEIYKFDYQNQTGDLNGVMVNFTLNKQGYLLTVEYQDHESQYSGHGSFSYTEEGYLKRIEFNSERDNDYLGKEVHEFSYADGDLVQIRSIYGLADVEITQFEYDGKKENKAGIIPQGSILGIDDLLDDESDVLYQAGLLGKVNQHLVTARIYQGSYEIRNIQYSFDQKGYVTSYTYNDGDEKISYKFKEPL